MVPGVVYLLEQLKASFCPLTSMSPLALVREREVDFPPLWATLVSPTLTQCRSFIALMATETERERLQLDLKLHVEFDVVAAGKVVF